MAEDKDRGFELELDRQEGYRFQVTFDQEGLPRVVMDEPPPLGENQGANAARFLGAAIGNCLSASLLHCLEKSRVEPGAIHTTVRGSVVRNDDGRLRVNRVSVVIDPEIAEGEEDRIQRCLGLFEDYCIVTQSVRNGIEVDVTVKGAPG